MTAASRPRLSIPVADALDMEPNEVVLAGAALSRRGLVTGVGSLGVPILRFTNVSAEAYLYFVTGLHPSGDEAVSSLVAALRQAADQVDDPVERSRLRALADGVLGISRNVIGDVLRAVITQQITG